MKKFLLMICASATLCVGCEAVEDLYNDLFGEEEEEQPVEEAVFLNVSGEGETFQFPPEGGTFSVGVESSHYWIIEMHYDTPTDQQNWISASKYGGKGSNHVDITVAPNTDYFYHRRCELVFMMEEQGVGRVIVIEQEPALQ